MDRTLDDIDTRQRVLRTRSDYRGSACSGQGSATFNQTPDYPQSLGYKISWFALKASDPAPVLNALEIGDATPSIWESGLAVDYRPIEIPPMCRRSPFGNRAAFVELGARLLHRVAVLDRHFSGYLS